MPVTIIPKRKALLSFLLYLFLFSAPICAQQNEANNSGGRDVSIDTISAPRASDDCTMWFDGDYKDCCRQHDLDYLTGGDNWRTRLRADNRLFICIAGKKGVWHLALAPVMWIGVRIFGSDLSPSSRKNIVHRFFKRVFAGSKKRERQSPENRRRNKRD